MIPGSMTPGLVIPGSMAAAPARRPVPATVLPAIVLGAGLLFGSASLSGCSDDVAQPRGDDVSGLPAPDPTAAELIGRIIDAETKLAFAGWKTAHQGPHGSSRTSRVHVHRTPGGLALVTWEGEGERHQRWNYRQRHRWLESPALLLANYTVERDREPGPRIAWRDTVTIHIRGRSPHRPSLEIQADAETWLPLAETQRDHEGQVSFAWAYESVEFDPAPPANAPARPETVATPDDEDWGACSFDALVAANVPDGFRRVACRLLDCGAQREFWSDGLAAFSVRQRPAKAEDTLAAGALERRTGSGRAHVRGHVGGMIVEVAGSLRVEDLESVVRGLGSRPAD